MAGRKKLLLFGDNKSLRNDFFEHMWGEFEMLSCSHHTDDIQGHLAYYDPDALVLCLYKETREELSGLKIIKETLKKRRSSFIVAGDGIKCDEFERTMPHLADFIVRRSRVNTYQAMESQIASYLNTRAIYRSSRTDAPTSPAMDRNASIDMPMQNPMGMPEHTPMGMPEYTPMSSVPTRSPGGAAGGDSLDALLAAAAEAVQEMAAMPAQRAPGARRHVLVVDDDSSMLRMIKEILSDRYDVATAISGKVALKFLESRRTDVILLDYEMPEQSGAEVYRRILQNPATKHIPVVFLTGVSERARIAEVLAMRPRGYLLKPLDSERLKKTITEIVG